VHVFILGLYVWLELAADYVKWYAIATLYLSPFNVIPVTHI